MAGDVYILGGWQTDFAANWAREGLEIADAVLEPDEVRAVLGKLQQCFGLEAHVAAAVNNHAQTGRATNRGNVFP
jgi:hypothetical protein